MEINVLETIHIMLILIIHHNVIHPVNIITTQIVQTEMFVQVQILVHHPINTLYNHHLNNV